MFIVKFEFRPERLWPDPSAPEKLQEEYPLNNAQDHEEAKRHAHELLNEIRHGIHNRHILPIVGGEFVKIELLEIVNEETTNVIDLLPEFKLAHPNL